MKTGYLHTKLGLIEIAANDAGITKIEFVDEHKSHFEQMNQHVEQGIEQLQQYFAGQRRCFDLPLVPQGTIFQQQVWQALLSIQYGKTGSYADIARQINNPKAVRAVGAANGKNPIAIVVPCHRIIGSNGKLTGYAGGLHRKEFLLALEQT